MNKSLLAAGVERQTGKTAIELTFIKSPKRFGVDYSKFVPPTKANYPSFLKHTPQNSLQIQQNAHRRTDAFRAS